MDITYHEENGYLIPNVVVGCDSARSIGKYGLMRREYLREHSSGSVWSNGSERNLV